MAKKKKTIETPNDSLDKNRQIILNLLASKSALKQDVADDSEKMFEIVRRYADDVEEYSIDECFADLTGLDKPLYMSYKEIAERIKKEINEELGLSISVGLASTKVLAKVIIMVDENGKFDYKIQKAEYIDLQSRKSELTKNGN